MRYSNVGEAEYSGFAVHKVEYEGGGPALIRVPRRGEVKAAEVSEDS